MLKRSPQKPSFVPRLVYPRFHNLLKLKAQTALSAVIDEFPRRPRPDDQPRNALTQAAAISTPTRPFLPAINGFSYDSPLLQNYLNICTQVLTLSAVGGICILITVNNSLVPILRLGSSLEGTTFTSGKGDFLSSKGYLE